MFEKYPDLMTIEQVGEALGLQVPVIRRFIDRGILKAVNLSAGTQRANWKVAKETLREFVKQGGNINVRNY